MSETKQVEAGSLKKGSYVCFDGKAYIVRETLKSKPGKHGAKKCRMEAVCMTDDSKVIKVMPAHDNVLVPIIGKRTAQVLSVLQDKVNVMDMESYETFDLKIPEDLKDKIKEGVQVIYWEVMDDRIIKEVKEST